MNLLSSSDKAFNVDRDNENKILQSAGLVFIHIDFDAYVLKAFQQKII